MHLGFFFFPGTDFHNTELAPFIPVQSSSSPRWCPKVCLQSLLESMSRQERNTGRERDESKHSLISDLELEWRARNYGTLPRAECRDAQLEATYWYFLSYNWKPWKHHDLFSFTKTGEHFLLILVWTVDLCLFHTFKKIIKKRAKHVKTIFVGREC